MKKNVLITGGAGNLGRAVVNKFTDNDYHVISTVEPGRGNTIPQLENAKKVEIDLKNEILVKEEINEIFLSGDPIDAAVLLAGGFTMGNLEETSLSDIESMLEINFFTAYNVARNVFLGMKSQGSGGRIVMISAKPVFDSSASSFLVAYTLSKSLLVNLSEIINQEGKEYGITCSVIAPSIIDTPPNRSAMPEGDFRKWVSPESIAEVIYFICSDAGIDLRENIFKVYGDS